MAALIGFRDFESLRFTEDPRVRTLHVVDPVFGPVVFVGVLVEPGVVELAEFGELKELLLLIGWKRPLHVVVVIDDLRREERLVTVYKPDAGMWTSDYRRRH